jgi:hypothetical protein
MKSCKVVGSEVGTETTKEAMKIAGFWDVTLCSCSVLEEYDASIIRKNAGGSVKTTVTCD